MAKLCVISQCRLFISFSSLAATSSRSVNLVYPLSANSTLFFRFIGSYRLSIKPLLMYLLNFWIRLESLLSSCEISDSCEPLSESIPSSTGRENRFGMSDLKQMSSCSSFFLLIRISYMLSSKAFLKQALLMRDLIKINLLKTGYWLTISRNSSAGTW